MLSQNLIQHGKNLRYTDPTALYQAGNQLDVANRCTVKRISFIVAFFFKARFRQTIWLTARGIQMLFLFLAFRGLIIFDAAAYGILLPVGIPAAKRTAKINTPCIAGMGKK